MTHQKKITIPISAVTGK